MNQQTFKMSLNSLQVYWNLGLSVWSNMSYLALLSKTPSFIKGHLKCPYKQKIGQGFFIPGLNQRFI